VQVTDLFCVKLDWVKGVEAVGRLHTQLDTHLVPPTLEHFLAQATSFSHTIHDLGGLYGSIFNFTSFTISTFSVDHFRLYFLLQLEFY
jgi:hypothetical protein